MSNFSALIATIQANINTNGNEEITGAVLQEVLEAIVQALGTEAINNLETALSNEVGNRQNADSTLQDNIDAEALRAGTAEGALQTAINGIKSNIDNGFVYAGIATPSGTPVSGRVFYLAKEAGTYTNFGGLVVTQGINILKYNGTVWSQEQLIALDNTPTPSSSGLVKSGGVFEEIMTNGSAFDLTVHNSGTTYADLSAALTAMDSLPAAYKKGGMSIKFVQTSDNKYVQFRLMANAWSTTVTDWQGVDDEPTAGSNNLAKSGGAHLSILNSKNALSFELLGTTALTGQSKNGLYIYNGGFVEGNSHTMYDVSSCRGKHLSILQNLSNYHNWGFLADYDYDTKVVVFADDNSIITDTDLTSILVPTTANYLYVYTGGPASNTPPVLVVDEGNSFGQIQTISQNYQNTVHAVGGIVLNTSDKAWFHFANRNKYAHIIIPINPEDNISISNNSSNFVRANFLKDYIPRFATIPSGASYGVAYAGNIMCDVSPITDVFEGTAPSDAHFLYVLADYDTNGYKYIPNEIKVNNKKVVLPSLPDIVDTIQDTVDDINDTFAFSNPNFNKIVKEVYIQGSSVDLSSVDRFRLFLGMQSGNYYYTGIVLFHGETSLVIASKDYSSLEASLAPVANGIFDITSFSTNTLGLSRIVLAGDFVNNVGNHYFDGTLSNNCKSIVFSPTISSYLNISKVGIQKINSTSFYLLKHSNGGLLKYKWEHLHWDSTFNSATVIDQDCWSNDSIYKVGSSTVEVAQCNINFIHMFADGPELHTGNGHGCTVDTKFELFVDGTKVDFSSISNNATIEGDDIYIIQQSDGYYPDRQRTIDNNDGVLNGNRVFAKLDESGNPILAVKWRLDYHMTPNNESYINKLFIANDNTSFRRLYGAMNCIYPNSNCHTVVINDANGTVNTYVRENNAWTVTDAHGDDLSASGKIQLNGATKVIQYGDDFRLETECINDLHPTFGRVLPWFDTNSAGGRIKMYLVPVNVTPTETIEGNEGIAADVFNSGDVISCHVKRNVSIY